MANAEDSRDSQADRTLAEPPASAERPTTRTCG